MYREINQDETDLNGQPPTQEPQRQYYYIGQCRKWARAFEGEHGRSPRACVKTFGCQMNARDSEKLAGILAQIGYEETDREEEADFILYNTCTVREHANLKVYGRLGYLGRLKKGKPGLRIALCGCMMQEAQVLEKIRTEYPFVDLAFGTHNIYKFAELFCARLKTGRQVIDVWEAAEQIVEDLPVERKYPFKSGVNIMFGCNNFCSYCIVPYVRGRERSRDVGAILAEIRKLVGEGVVEVMLLGQNVNSYGKTLDPPVTFAQLLQQVEQIEGLQRIRFMTSHPKDLSPELIRVMAASKKICPHLHLPLQSGSTRLLGEMNRKYTKEQYLALVAQLRQAMPDLSLTTDIIVGFPGETEEDFCDTLEVIREARFDAAFTFLYSKRTGTKAAIMDNQVPKEVAKERFDRLLKTVQRIGAEQARRFEGRVLDVLVEEENRQEAGYLTGRLGCNMLVHFPGSAALIGNVVPVRLRECKGFYYLGELVTVPARDEMTIGEFDRMMATGFRQAKNDESSDVDEVFAELEQGEDG